MKYKIGIDVGGTFTDFLLTAEDGSSRIYKVLSTPDDPSVATMKGIEEMARDLDLDVKTFLDRVAVIVHGTTVTTNAVLTYTGAKTGLLTTSGVRDALEMRRGVREEQYNNRYRNAEPLVERYLRLPVRGRLDYKGDEIEPLNEEDARDGVRLLEKEQVKAVAVCFMNSFANYAHEKAVGELVRELLPTAYLAVSHEVLPSIRFYDRISTTVLNAYVGPILSQYLDALRKKLEAVEYGGVLLIMQSNGGVISPDIARKQAASTLLSGPAGGPVAGIAYTSIQGYRDCITMDMGGTSFDTALIKDRTPLVTTVGEINRLRLALPMLNVVTIGAGGGSIGWLDEGGLLRMGPRSAGSKPGPVCYDLGGEEPTCTDADLILGYLDPGYFAGGRIKLNLDKAVEAVRRDIADPLGMDVMEAAAGMYSVINVNMAAAVREVSVQQGQDPRDFPLVVAGGAGPNHACMIAKELEIPAMLIPSESSIFCAAGMLMSDLKHDFVRSYPTLLDETDPERFRNLFGEMEDEGRRLLAIEKIPHERISFVYALDLRYVRQYHELTLEVPRSEIEGVEAASIGKRFHPRHDRMYGYSLEDDGTKIELINLRLTAIGLTDKPRFTEQPFDGESPEKAFKGTRSVYLPLERRKSETPVFEGDRLFFGNHMVGPAIIEQVNTTTFITPEYNALVDRYGSYTVYLKSRETEFKRRVLA